MGIWGAAMIAFPMGTAMSVLQGAELEADRVCLGIIMLAWSNPQLPGIIRAFLISLREESARKVGVRMEMKRRGNGNVGIISHR